MNTIVPHLWFDTEAKEAAELYTSVFPNSKVTHVNTIKDTPSGDCDIVSFELAGQKFMAISAGPIFKLNPSISFIVNFDPSKDTDARASVDLAWEKLSEGGTILMPLQQYPFSEHYGWIQDRFGLSWQLMLTNPEGEPRPFITPTLMFTGAVCGKTEEAITFYTSVFENSKVGNVMKYGAGHEPDAEGSVMFADFTLLGQWFAAMDSAHPHGFKFNEALSFIVKCSTQDEIDYFSDKLSAVPEAEQCGWIKDQYGVSWQITPTMMDDLMSTGTPEQNARVTQTFLKMKRFNIAKLQEAFDGN